MTTNGPAMTLSREPFVRETSFEGHGQLLKQAPLRLAETVVAALSRSRPAPASPQSAVQLFAQALMSDEPGAGFEYAEALLHRGIPLERLCGVHVPAVARHFGQLWTEDRASFTDVTVAMSRLQDIIRDLVGRQEYPSGARRRVLIALAPGETHAIGVMLLAGRLRQQGYLVRMELTTSQQGIEAMLRHSRFDALGFSVGSERSLDPLQSTISHLRARVDVPPILVGGALVEIDPASLEAIGADHVARSEADALGFLADKCAQPI